SGLSIGPDVRTVEGEVAGVARPHPVVDVTAVLADAVGRAVYQAHVLDFEPVDELVLRAAEKARDLAAVAGLLLAAGHDLLAAILDDVVDIAAAHVGVDALADAGGDILDRDRDIHARARRGRQLGAHVFGQKAFFQVVVVSGGVVLDGASGAVVVGYHQAFGRDEACRTTAQRDDCAHGKGSQLVQIV